MEAIKTDGLTKRYKDICAVNSLSLSVNQGELFSLLGVNGSGKTTTIKMLSCLTKPNEGEGWILGESIVGNEEKVKGLISVSPQESAIAPNLTVKENLELMAGVHGFGSEKIKRNTLQMTETFGLDSVIYKRAGKLSGGWQRRLSIAMALISEPKVLFLDEPTLGLDVLAREELWDIISSLKGKITIILTTHYMEEAQSLSDRIGVMKDGKLVFVGTSDEMIKKAEADNFEKAFVRIVKEAQ